MLRAHTSAGAAMRVASLLGTLLVLLHAPNAAAFSSFGEAAERLDGEWRGANFVLKVDSKRAQASIDPTRPFAWERFVIREVVENEVVFAIGAELFEAKLEADMLVLTGTSFRGEQLLFRDTGLRGTTD
jgi:hypothetical protein